MEDYVIWWVAMGLLLIIELATGSFYLLMLAIATIIGAICAHLNLNLFWQLLTAATFGIFALGTCYYLRKNLIRKDKNNFNNLDIGAVVMIKNWQEDGLAKVKYRGASWIAVSNNNNHNVGLHKIVAISGNRLVVEFN